MATKEQTIAVMRLVEQCSADAVALLRQSEQMLSLTEALGIDWLEADDQFDVEGEMTPLAEHGVHPTLREFYEASGVLRNLLKDVGDHGLTKLLRTSLVAVEGNY